MARRPLRMSCVCMYFVLGLMKPALSDVPPPSEAGFCAFASYMRVGAASMPPERPLAKTDLTDRNSIRKPTLRPNAHVEERLKKQK